MIGVADGPTELEIGSSILTRRGGTDANAPESPQEAIPRDWHVGILGPQSLEENVATKISIEKSYNPVI